MKLARLAILATGLTLTGTLLAPSAAMAAPATRVLLPTAVKPKVVQKVKIDVDGDGRKDTVTVTRISSRSYKVAVTTARKKTSSITLTSTIKQDWGEDNPYWGAARLDPVKGYELLIATSGGDGWNTTVLTWRKGKLVRQAAPQPRDSKYAWYSLANGWGRAGHRFFTKGSTRYVEQFFLEQDGSRWKGGVVTSKWTGSGWKKTSAKKVSLTASQAKKYGQGGFVGVKVVQP